MTSLRVHSGVHEEFEAVADEIIFGHLNQITNREEKSDILTPWKLRNRADREVLTATGAPVDGQIRRGLYHRSYNPQQTHLNSYDGATRPPRLDANWDPERGERSGPLSPQMSEVVGVMRID